MKGKPLYHFAHSGLRSSFLGNSQKLGNIFPLNHQKEVFIAYYGSHSPSLMSPKLAQSSGTLYDPKYRRYMRGKPLYHFAHSGLRWSFLGNSRKLGNIFPLSHQDKVFIAYFGSHSPSLMSPKLAQSSRAL